MSIKQVIVDGGKPIKIWTDNVEDEALTQLKNLSRLPFIYKQVSVMPDVHGGKGSTIGTVMSNQDDLVTVLPTLKQ
ncbi:MAG: RtcB family protein, partial [Ignisphaera sp.]|nr:RtcB family protein [Ignisphaera sp.]